MYYVVKRVRKRTGFTLIELLVVIAIISLLMAILTPVLQLVRKQATSVACQASLRQWGLACAMYVAENSGKFFTNDEFFTLLADDERSGGEASGGRRKYRLAGIEGGSADLYLCPIARKPGEMLFEWGAYQWVGSTYSAWGEGTDVLTEYGPDLVGSYGLNPFVVTWPSNHLHENRSPKYWQTCLVEGTQNIPVMSDSSSRLVTYPSFGELEGPPEAEQFSSGACIDRHQGGINCVFMDWSVRKVGLKELWTLKWHRQYDTRGPWTKAGGVWPGDWPGWMRKCEDY